MDQKIQVTIITAVFSLINGIINIYVKTGDKTRKRVRKGGEDTSPPGDRRQC